jgi:hypothetical protein
VGSYRALLVLDPTDPADLHLELARVLRSQGRVSEAKRHVLQALEEAPRFREAQRELLSLAGAPDSPASGAGAPESGPPTAPGDALPAPDAGPEEKP